MLTCYLCGLKLCILVTPLNNVRNFLRNYLKFWNITSKSGNLLIFFSYFFLLLLLKTKRVVIFLCMHIKFQSLEKLDVYAAKLSTEPIMGLYAWRERADEQTSRRESKSERERWEWERERGHSECDKHKSHESQVKNANIAVSPSAHRMEILCTLASSAQTNKPFSVSSSSQSFYRWKNVEKGGFCLPKNVSQFFNLA